MKLEFSKRLRIILLIPTLLFVVSSFAFAEQYKVTRITDGDTIQVIADDTKQSFAWSASMPQKFHMPKISRGNRSAKLPPSTWPVWC
jgi:hypothetical protein